MQYNSRCFSSTGISLLVGALLDGLPEVQADVDTLAKELCVETEADCCCGGLILLAPAIGLGSDVGVALQNMAGSADSSAGDL